MAVGPAISLAVFAAGDVRAVLRGDRAVLRAWAWHLPAVGVVMAAHAAIGFMPLWAVLAAAYLSHAILKVRTYAEHRAHAHAGGRTVVIEDRGPLALIFLNNNLHVVHHMHPKVAWYRLPTLYRENRGRYLRRNGSYVFPSYATLFRRHFWRAKDPVAHPLRDGEGGTEGARSRHPPPRRAPAPRDATAG